MHIRLNVLAISLVTNVVLLVAQMSALMPLAIVKLKSAKSMISPNYSSRLLRHRFLGISRETLMLITVI